MQSSILFYLLFLTHIFLKPPLLYALTYQENHNTSFESEIISAYNKSIDEANDRSLLEQAFYHYYDNNADGALKYLNLLFEKRNSRVDEQILGLNLLGHILIDNGFIYDANRVIYLLKNLSQSEVSSSMFDLEIKLIRKYSESDIQHERDLLKKELNAVSKEVYEMARQAMNMQAGEVVHHAIEAGTHGIKSWEHYRQAKKMENENNRECDSSGCFENTTIKIERD